MTRTPTAPTYPLPALAEPSERSTRPSAAVLRLSALHVCWTP